MFIIKNKFVFLGISAVLILASLCCVAFFGIRKGIDFAGGALVEVSYEKGRPEATLLRDNLIAKGVADVSLQESGTSDILVKTHALSEGDRSALIANLTLDASNPAKEKSFTSIGPSVGKEMTRKAISAIVLVALAIVAFIAFAFRGVSRPIASWKYGLIAIITLAHDIIIPTGVFAVMGKLYGVEMDTLFVVALLTILGLSVSDTIVVFDRIRENLKNKFSTDFAETVGVSIEQTFTRSINTSLSTILALVALFFFGPETTKYFALTLMVGMSVGTYSSIFVASPVLVLVEKWQRDHAKGKK